MSAVRTFAILASAVALTVFAPAQTRFSFNVGTSNNNGEVYVAPESNGFLFYVGEPIHMVLHIGNPDDVSHRLVSDPHYGEDTFRQRIEPAGQRTFEPPSDRMNVDSQIVKSVGDVRESVQWEQTMVVESQASLTWTVDLSVYPAPPGLYNIRINCKAADEAGAPIRDTVFPVEIRAVTPDAQAEVHRRAMDLALQEKRYSDVEKEAKALLAANPGSVYAHLGPSDMYNALGDKAGALSEALAAQRVVQTGADVLWQRFANERSQADLKDIVARRVERMRR